jgi:hypothetical protein
VDDILEGLDERWVTLTQQGTEVVSDVLPVPDGVLLGAGEHADRLGQLGVSR